VRCGRGQRRTGLLDVLAELGVLAAAVAVTGVVTAGSGTAAADGSGAGSGHALPYAADGSVFSAWSAAMDARAAADARDDGPWRAVKFQASSARRVRPAARMKNRRRQRRPGSARRQ
jgi:hypothetical protein